MSKLDDMIDSMLEDRLDAAITRALERKLGVTTPAQPAAPVADEPKPRVPRHHQQKWPVGTRVRVNQTYVGHPAAPGTKVHAVWAAIKQHLGVEEQERTSLGKEIDIILNLPTNTSSHTISRLLFLGALVAVHRKQA